MSLQLIKVKELDKNLLFEWRNLPEIIALSTSQKKVTYAEHSAWFNKMYSDANILSFIIQINGTPYGHARLEKTDNQCIITVYLLESNVGKGYGTQAISLACAESTQKWKGLPIVAFIRESNYRAQASFKKVGFQLCSMSTPDNHVAMMFDSVQSEESYTASHYSQRMDQYGDTFESLNWGSQQGQELRFSVLAGIDDLNGKTILDVGCGLGDFAGWLQSNNIDVDYTGIDITEKFIQTASQKYPGYKFFTQSISDSSQFASDGFDYVFASGIFATYAVNGSEWLQSCVKAMWKLARKGIAFNSLSTWAEDKDSNEYYAKPDELVQIAKKMTPWVVLRHDYHPRDMTLYMTRDKRK